MAKLMLMKSSITVVLLFTLLCIVMHEVSANYCSAYCSYYNLGAAYTPMCTSTTNLTCTKCDEYLFTLNGTHCVPHGKFN